MSSLFQGLTTPDGKFRLTSALPVSFFRGLGFDANGALCVGDPPAVAWTAGIPTNATGHVVATADKPTRFGPGGLPLNAAGSVCFRNTVPVSYLHGVGYDVDGAIAQGFSPLDLFAAGEAGAWYDPTDLSSMAQDVNGMTPVTSVEQTVGLVLDKSQPLGAEKYTNQNCSVDNAVGGATFLYTPPRTMTILTAGTAPSYPRMPYGIGLTAGKYYRVVGRIDGNRQMITTIRLAASGGANNISYNSTTGVFSGTVAASTTAIEFHVDGRIVGTFTIAELSVREAPGNHLTQATASARPTLRARYNLLTSSDFAGGGAVPTGWTTAGTGSSTPVGSDAEGNVIYRQVCNNQTAYFDNANTIPISAVAGSAMTLHLRIGTIRSGTVQANHMMTWAAFPAGATDQWFRNGVPINSWDLISSGDTISIVCISGGTAGALRARVGLGVAGNTTADVEFSRPQVDYGNTGAKPRTYQRTTGASGYDTNPALFPPYLDFDGVDDGMATAASVNFSATNKMTSCAGLVKRSDAAYAAILDLTNAPDTSPGAYGIGAGTLNGDASRRTWASVTLGTTSPLLGGVGVYASPVASIVTATTDNSQATAALQMQQRIDGVAKTSTYSAATGPGNYANAPLFVGRRGGVSAPFNGQIHQLIVRGAASTAAQLSGMESFVASKMGPLAPVLP